MNTTKSPALFRVMTPEAREAFNAESRSIDATLKADWKARYASQKAGFLQIARRFNKKVKAGKYGIEISPRNWSEFDDISNAMRSAGVEVSASMPKRIWLSNAS
jgi:hypothetical protein